MRNVFIASYDMEVGGVERSLINMLEHFDYENYAVDLLLYRKRGDFLSLLPKQAKLLDEVRQLSTFRKSIRETFAEKQYGIAIARLLSRLRANWQGRMKGIEEPGYMQLQLMWEYALPFLPAVRTTYDAAISYLWPHHYVAHKVKAARKIAWVHTDYSTVPTDADKDYRLWNRFDYIVTVSEACKRSFLMKYKGLEPKVVVMENVTSPEFIRKMAEEGTASPLDKDGRFKVLTVARLSHAKGIDYAVKALRLLKDKGYERIVWYVIGYGGDENGIRRLITDNGLEQSFILLGKKTNPYPYMKACDLYVQPSRYEGKAVTVTEAQIVGKAVLITNYATASSQVRDRVDGVITRLSIEGIADGIERLYADKSLRESLMDNCRKKDFANLRELETLYRLMNG